MIVNNRNFIFFFQLTIIALFFSPFIKSGSIYTKFRNFVFNVYLRIQFSMAIIVITIKDVCEPEHVLQTLTFVENMYSPHFQIPVQSHALPDYSGMPDSTEGPHKYATY